MGPVPYKTFGFLQYSFKSFSISRRYIIDGLGDNSAVGELPLWHSAIFQSEKQLTYYCPALIRQGITQVKHMFVIGAPQEEVLKKIGPTWRQVYRCTQVYSSCLLCHTVETLDHTLGECLFHKFMFALLEKVSEPLRTQGKQYECGHIPVQHFFKSPQGIA